MERKTLYSDIVSALSCYAKTNKKGEVRNASYLFYILVLVLQLQSLSYVKLKNKNMYEDIKVRLSEVISEAKILERKNCTRTSNNSLLTIKAFLMNIERQLDELSLLLRAEGFYFEKHKTYILKILSNARNDVLDFKSEFGNIISTMQTQFVDIVSWFESDFENSVKQVEYKKLNTSFDEIKQEIDSMKSIVNKLLRSVLECLHSRFDTGGNANFVNIADVEEIVSRILKNEVSESIFNVKWHIDEMLITNTDNFVLKSKNVTLLDVLRDIEDEIESALSLRKDDFLREDYFNTVEIQCLRLTQYFWQNQVALIDFVTEIKRENPGFNYCLNIINLLDDYLISEHDLNDRIRNQKGGFLIQGLNFGTRSFDKHIFKIMCITPEGVKDIRTRLEALGITKEYIYPDLEHFDYKKYK